MIYNQYQFCSKEDFQKGAKYAVVNWILIFVRKSTAVDGVCVCMNKSPLKLT